LQTAFLHFNYFFITKLMLFYDVNVY